MILKKYKFAHTRCAPAERKNKILLYNLAPDGRFETRTIKKCCMDICSVPLGLVCGTIEMN